MKQKLLGFLPIFISCIVLAQTPGTLGSFKTFNSGQAVTCITVDSNNNVWAGSNKQGLFFLDQKNNASSFVAASGASSVSTYVILGLAADKLGNLWVGHSGTGGTTSSAGGVAQFNYSSGSLVRTYEAARDMKGPLSYIERDGLATRSVKSITCDPNNTLWVAHRYHDLTASPDYIVTPGAMSYKRATDPIFTTKGGYYNKGTYPEWPYPAYTYNPEPSQTPQSRVCYAIGSDSNEVWIGVAAYKFDVSALGMPIFGNLPTRILTYDLNGTFKGSISFETIGIPAGVGFFNGIFLSPKHDAWVTTTAGRGFAVRRLNTWTYMDFTKLSCIIPSGTLVNDNAIWGNKHGNVFIGTNNGLIVYNGRGPVSVSSSYTFYSTAVNTDMVSNNISGGYSQDDSIQWIATDKGIMKTIIGLYSTIDPKGEDYTSCGNAEINDIENRLKAPGVRNDLSYHIYKVETEICSTSGPNGKYCTAEYVYNMMKDSIVYTAVIPYDFPLDGLTTSFLDKLSLADLKTIQDKINAYPMETVDTEPEAGDIKRMADVVPTQELKDALDGESDWYQGLPYEIGQLTSLGYFGSSIPRKLCYDRQLELNPMKTISCTQRYKLFNSPNFIQARHVFKFGTTTFIGRFVLGCDADGLESSVYDPIYVYVNDKNYVFTNYTSKGHMLAPGKITRQVIEECGKVKIVTIGEGVQFCGNNTAGRRNAYGNIVAGCVLFKNVDFRLKRAFEKRK